VKFLAAAEKIGLEDVLSKANMKRWRSFEQK
jgi:hypothetical protein